MYLTNLRIHELSLVVSLAVQRAGVQLLELVPARVARHAALPRVRVVGPTRVPPEVGRGEAVHVRAHDLRAALAVGLADAGHVARVRRGHGLHLLTGGVETAIEPTLWGRL